MYEDWNEPSGATWATIKTYHETVVAAIRAVDPDNIIFLGTPNWDQEPNLLGRPGYHLDESGLYVPLLRE